ncbi:hypothetical protein OG455_02875 [Kitasatospora sp. NBC_01287]|uniref:hypothetical protein n=1 Tax=Kitasatospora sp. NBC_01287 TaxID=2903573 RepID=UPI002257BCA9|nr:hypothetical protein [Kitasatospora sp. NBC_01287]MCX4744471.1 hypothetical protein [Kitasatospora sp. NBC_01287]
MFKEDQRTHRRRTGGPPPFTLWREVVVAYLAPALSAGAGGLARGSAELTWAAGTSIAGTSALVALVTGGWLRRAGTRRRWPSALPRTVLAPALGLLAAGLALGVAFGLGWSARHGLPGWNWSPTASWLDRLRLDLPISAALAATIISWRWRGRTGADTVRGNR